MRQLLLHTTAASAAVIASSAAHAQTGAAIARVSAAPTVSPKLAVVIPRIEQAADAAQIAPVVAPPALPDTLLVRTANPLASIQRLPVERDLSLSEIRSTRALKLGSATIDLSAMLENPNALPNVARRLEAAPSAVTVEAVDVKAYVVPQGLIVRSFLSYQIKAGTCSDAARRRAIEQAGIGCARKESESERVGDYSNPDSARFVADPAQRSATIAKARGDWARQDAETAAQVANFRAILANPTERAKVAAEIGAADTARFEAMSDDALAGELISAAETKIEDIMFIPKEDEVDRGARGMIDDYRRRLAMPMLTNTVENQQIDKVVFLTGFTLGRQYEWSKRIEKTIKWCWVGCAVTYYAGARAGFSYGFGLRFPIVLDGNYRYEQNGRTERASLTATMTPVDGSPAQYAAAGLGSSQIFKGQEFVAELKASAGYEYKLPLIGEGRRTLTVGYDLAEMLPAPYTRGQFTPPMPGTTSGEIPFVLNSIDLLMGYGNWGAAGVLVHPAVKVGLRSDALRFTVHDNVAGTDQDIVNGKKLPIAVDPANGTSSFWIGEPVYNLGFIVTPGVDARAFIDVGVWSNSWHFPVWFPDIAITLPPGGVDFACHAGTICRRDYSYTATNRPALVGAAATGTLEVMGDADRPRPRPELSGAATAGSLQVIGNAETQVAPPASSAGDVGPVLPRAEGVRLRQRALAPSACPEGLVERRATRTDARCVTADERKRIASENRLDSANHDPNGAYGPATCIDGLVWRDAVPGDQVCVTPERRAAVAATNR